VTEKMASHGCTTQDPAHARTVGQFIQDARSAKGWTVRDLAAAAPGVSHSTVVRCEQGKPVAHAHLVAVLAALGFSLVVVAGIRPPVERIAEAVAHA